MTLEEAARRLAVPIDEIQALIRSGRLETYRLGGRFHRVRLGQVERLREAVRGVRTGGRALALQESGPGGEGAGQSGRLSSATGSSPARAVSPDRSGSLWERVVDFFYFNDFYLASALILLTLLAILLTL